jgi:hypothetical protein
MQKSGIPTRPTGRPGRLPRNPGVRRADPDPPPSPPRNALKRTKKAHFLEPYRLSDKTRAALLDYLSTRGVGDPESRELFAAAVEYGIASSRPTAKDAPAPNEQPVATDAPPPAVDPPRPVSPIAETARLLVQGLDALDARSREAITERLRLSDPFDRIHDSAYLDAIRRELERIAQAAAAALDAAPAARQEARSEPTPAKALAHAKRPEDPIGAATRRLVLRVADAYEACFETKVETSSESAFVPVLRLISAEAEIPMPADDGPIGAILAGR